MSGIAIEQGSAWLALGLMLAALAAGLAAALARTLLAMCLYVCAACVAAAAAALALGAGAAALTLAVAGGAWIPVLLLMGMSLGGRVAKSHRLRRPWLSAAFAAVLAVMLAWAANGQSPSADGALASIAPGAGPSGAWIAVLVFVAGSACVALLGYGERGVLERREPGGER